MRLTHTSFVKTVPLPIANPPDFSKSSLELIPSHSPTRLIRNDPPPLEVHGTERGDKKGYKEYV